MARASEPAEWGYGQDEHLDNDDLIAERYRGIRPAFGYSACPDHSEKEKLLALLGPESVGIELTESWAMLPAASVSGLYFAHPHGRPVGSHFIFDELSAGDARTPRGTRALSAVRATSPRRRHRLGGGGRCDRSGGVTSRR